MKRRASFSSLDYEKEASKKALEEVALSKRLLEENLQLRFALEELEKEILRLKGGTKNFFYHLHATEAERKATQDSDDEEPILYDTRNSLQLRNLELDPSSKVSTQGSVRFFDYPGLETSESEKDEIIAILVEENKQLRIQLQHILNSSPEEFPISDSFDIEDNSDSPELAELKKINRTISALFSPNKMAVDDKHWDDR